jgi:hypothetical protein
MSLYIPFGFMQENATPTPTPTPTPTGTPTPTPTKTTTPTPTPTKTGTPTPTPTKTTTPTPTATNTPTPTMTPTPSSGQLAIYWEVNYNRTFNDDIRFRDSMANLVTNSGTNFLSPYVTGYNGQTTGLTYVLLSDWVSITTNTINYASNKLVQPTCPAYSNGNEGITNYEFILYKNNVQVYFKNQNISNNGINSTNCGGGFPTGGGILPEISHSVFSGSSIGDVFKVVTTYTTDTILLPTPTVTPTVTPTSVTPTPTPTPLVCAYNFNYTVTTAGTFQWTQCDGTPAEQYLSVATWTFTLGYDGCVNVSSISSNDGGIGSKTSYGTACYVAPTPTPTPTPTGTPPAYNYYTFTPCVGGTGIDYRSILSLALNDVYAFQASPPARNCYEITSITASVNSNDLPTIYGPKTDCSDSDCTQP